MKTEKNRLGFQAFIKEVSQRMRERLGGGYRIEEMEADDLNGTVKHSLLVAREGAAVRPRFNMDQCYRFYREGLDIRTVTDELIKALGENIPVGDAQVFNLADWNSVKGRLRGKLVNTEKNRIFLQGVPHREYLDLSIVYYIHVAEIAAGSSYGLQICNDHMAMWDADEGMLYRAFEENIGDVDEVLFENMSGFLTPYLQTDWKPVFSTNDPGRYILGNKSGANGAVQMCNRNVLGAVAEYFRGDFWILPSSVHEVILVPCRWMEDAARELARTVKEINDSQVARNEFLSNHVYRYERDTGNVRIEA